MMAELEKYATRKTANVDSGPLYSVYLLLPDSAQRRLRRWTERTAGASWPSWRGHITLLPWFCTDMEERELSAIMVSVCSHYASFRLSLNTLTAEPDVTREIYWLTMLVGRDGDISGVETLVSLQSALAKALSVAERSRFVGLQPAAFHPHVTLALGLGRVEAEQLVANYRPADITVEFDVDRVWLLRKNHAEDEPLEVESFPLAEETVPS